MIELLTSRLRIRDHKVEDLDAMHRLLSDPIAMRYLPDIRTDDLNGTRDNLLEAINAADRTDRTKWFFAVTDRNSEMYLGEVGYTVCAESTMGKVVQLGYFLLPRCWGEGIATEAAEAVLRFAFTEGGVCKVETGCLTENSASEGVMKKLGMTREAVLLCHTPHEGVLKDRVEYRMLRTEWERRHAVVHAGHGQAGGAEASSCGKQTMEADTTGFPRLEPTCLPKAILFDYGQTLIDEIGFDAVAGTEAVLREAVENPEHATAEEVQAMADAMLRELGRRGVTPEEQHPVEFHNHLFYRYLYEAFGMRFTKPILEVERIFWDTAAPGSPTPGMTALLAYLKRTGIRTGVISNISFSGDVLRERIERIFPDHRFDFILASSEYVFRKPHRRIFRMALHKLGLQAHEVWYCGDHAYFDVHGATRAGLFPIWYTGCHHAPETNIPGLSGNMPSDPCLEVKSWEALLPVLEQLALKQQSCDVKPD